MQKIRFMAVTLVVVSTALMFSAPAAFANNGNIVYNPGFELGSDGWTGNMYINSWQEESQLARNGSGFADTGCVGHYCMDQYEGSYVQQLLNTQAGQTYDVRFWVAEQGGSTSEMAFYWNGSLVADVLNPANNTCFWEGESCNYVQFTYTGLLATSDSTLFQVNGRQDPGGMFFDDFSVTPSGVPTPEPGSIALLASGLLGGLGVIRRKL